MRFAEQLPKDVVERIRAGVVAEYATLSRESVPIDTPTFYFPSADLQTLDIGTGLAYPAKAERARRNPKVGLLIEGTADQPVVSIAGYAAVRDSDLQANLERYLAETIFAPNVNPDVVPWEKVRKRLYYLTRVIVCVAPAHIRWWSNRAAMDEPPQEWRAPSDTVYPESDPAPPGKPSKAPEWRVLTWQQRAEAALSHALPAHLTLADGEGFPLPLRVVEYASHAEGFRMVVPKGAPWSEGKATLSFVGKEVFVGDARVEGEETVLRVDRALPVLPLFDDRPEDSRDAIATLVGRMDYEAKRRGQSVPTVPEIPPEPTEGAKIRAAASRAIDAAVPGGRADLAR